MIIKTYKRKDGSIGTKNLPQEKDEFISKYPTVKTTKMGEYFNNTLGVINNKGKLLHLTLTKQQTKTLNEHGNLTGKKISFYNYINKFGEQIGVKIQ